MSDPIATELEESSQQLVLQKILQYRSEVNHNYNPEWAHKMNATTYENELSKTINSVKDQLAKQRIELEKTRTSSSSSFLTTAAHDLVTRRQQLAIVKAAYDSLTPARPTLPASNSVIPSVQATKTVCGSITTSKANIELLEHQQESIARQASSDEQKIVELRALCAEIKLRTARLSDQNRRQEYRSKNDRTGDQMVVQRQLLRQYEVSTKALHRALGKFIMDELAPIVAVEEFGGPVGSILLDVDDDDLVAGSSHRSRPSKRANKASSLEDRQQRIDQVWSTGSHTRRNDNTRSEREIAAEDIRHLIEKLMKVGDIGRTTGAYVQLHQDSAAARFLVKARIAQLHPKDARRLRLIEFGRDIEDRSGQ